MSKPDYESVSSFLTIIRMDLEKNTGVKHSYAMSRLRALSGGLKPKSRRRLIMTMRAIEQLNRDIEIARESLNEFFASMVDDQKREEAAADERK